MWCRPPFPFFTSWEEELPGQDRGFAYPALFLSHTVLVQCSGSAWPKASHCTAHSELGFHLCSKVLSKAPPCTQGLDVFGCRGLWILQSFLPRHDFDIFGAYWGSMLRDNTVQVFEFVWSSFVIKLKFRNVEGHHWDEAPFGGHQARSARHWSVLVVAFGLVLL